MTKTGAATIGSVLRFSAAADSSSLVTDSYKVG